MKIERLNCFETNSSSTHSLVLCTENQWNDWKDNKCYFNIQNNKFITSQEYFDLKELKDCDYYNYYSFDKFYGLSTHEQCITSSNGEKFYACSMYEYE